MAFNIRPHEDLWLIHQARFVNDLIHQTIFFHPPQTPKDQIYLTFSNPPLAPIDNPKAAANLLGLMMILIERSRAICFYPRYIRSFYIRRE